jgi:DNA ligase (NAD+)
VVSREEEVAVYCANVDCPAQRVQRLTHFVGVMDVEGMGERTVFRLIDAGLVRNGADLYTLSRADLLGLEGFGEKSTDNVLAAIEATKDQPLERVIAALGIQGVGAIVAGVLAEHHASLRDLERAHREELEAIEGIGPHTAGAVVEWFEHEQNRAFVEKLRHVGVNLDRRSPVAPEGGPLQDLTFVITGTLSRPRREIADLIEDHGGRVTGSVSGNTDFLVLGDSPGQSKLKAARERGTTTIGEAELRRMVEGVAIEAA